MKRTLKNRLRIRFVLISMLSLFLFQTVIVGVSMFHNHRDLVNKSDMLISQLHSHPSGSKTEIVDAPTSDEKGTP